MIQNNIWELKNILRKDLKTFQGKLKKEDNQEQIEKLSKEIETQWFNAPIAVWNNNWDTSILDWHQRLKALELLATNNLTLENDEIPCIYIKADTEKKARQILLEYNTKYSSFDTLVLWEWVEWLELENLELQELRLLWDWDFDAEDEWEWMPEFNQDDKTWFKSIKIHFEIEEDYKNFAELIWQKLTMKTVSTWFPYTKIEKYIDKAYE